MKSDKKRKTRTKKSAKGFFVHIKEQGLWQTMKTLISRHATMQFVFRFFVLGLLFQFFAHTLVTFEWGLDYGWMTVVWLWKELVIVVLASVGVWSLVTGGAWGSVILRTVQQDRVFQFLALAVVFVINMSLLGTYVTEVGIKAWAIAAKYNIFPLVIALVWYVIGVHQGRDRVMKQLGWVAKVVSYLLVWSLFFYVIVGLKPGALKFFGYDPTVFEGVVGQAPPSIYLAHYNHGNARNHFLFERPITWGFYLVMMFPLFFVHYLRRAKISHVWGWWLLYVVAIAVTFSRAAWGVWFLSAVGLLLLAHRRLKYGLWLVGGACVLLGSVFVLYGRDIFARGYSDNGHLYALQDSIEMVSERLWWGHGAGAAGPASHQLHKIGFNPENQFLQIVIEYGLIGFLPWMVFFAIILSQGIVSYVTLGGPSRRQQSIDDQYRWYVIAITLGLCALSVEGLVLHSFADRMVIYPLMAMIGIVLGARKYS